MFIKLGPPFDYQSSCLTSVSPRYSLPVNPLICDNVVCFPSFLSTVTLDKSCDRRLLVKRNVYGIEMEN